MHEPFINDSYFIWSSKPETQDQINAWYKKETWWVATPHCATCEAVYKLKLPWEVPLNVMALQDVCLNA